MKIQIEFDLPDEKLAKAATQAASALFEGPDYGRRGAEGYCLIEAAAKKAIAEIDWTTIVKDQIAKMAPDVVHDVVGTVLKGMVRAKMKEMKESGELLK